MNATSASTFGRDPFMPRAPKVRGRAIALAVLAHALLIVGLMFSVDWRSDEPASVAAELWSATPQAAAPRAVEPPPAEPTTAPPVKPAEAEPRPTPKPPEPVVAQKPPTPALPDPQIAIDKAKREETKRAAAEQAEQQRLKLKLEREREIEQAERARETLAAQKQKADKLKVEQARIEQARNEKANAEKADKAEKADAARAAAVRDANLKRAAGLLDASGGATDTGTALKSSGLSASYAGRIAARIKPNILFTDLGEGNPAAVVQVRLAPDGTIIDKRLVRSSGVKSWDDAVLRAIERTETLPLDNGRAPPQFDIEFRPRF